MQQTRGFKQVDYIADKLEFESNEWRVLMWLSRIENKQRVTKELPRGQFYMSQREVVEKLNIPQTTLRRILKMFTEEGVITPIRLSKSRHQPSIYKMECVTEIVQKSGAVNDSVSGAVNDSVNTQVEPLQISTCDRVEGVANDSVNGAVNGAVDGSLLKEILKNNKNNKNNNITSED